MASIPKYPVGTKVMVQTWIGIVADIREKDPFGRPFYESPAYLIEWPDRPRDEEDQFNWRKENEIISLEDTGYNRRPRRAVVELYSTAAEVKSDGGRKRNSSDRQPSTKADEGTVPKRRKRAERVSAIESGASESLHSSLDDSNAPGLSATVETSLTSDRGGLGERASGRSGKGRAGNIQEGNVDDSVLGALNSSRVQPVSLRRKRSRHAVVEDDDEDDGGQSSSQAIYSNTQQEAARARPKVDNVKDAGTALQYVAARVAEIGNSTVSSLQTQALVLALKALVHSSTSVSPSIPLAGGHRGQARAFACMAFLVQAVSCPCRATSEQGSSSVEEVICSHVRLLVCKRDLLSQLLVLDVLQAWGLLMRQGLAQGSGSSSSSAGIALSGMHDAVAAMRDYVCYRLRGQWSRSIHPLVHRWEAALMPTEILKLWGPNDDTREVVVAGISNAVTAVTSTAPASSHIPVPNESTGVIIGGASSAAMHSTGTSSLSQQLDAILCTSQDVHNTTAEQEDIHASDAIIASGSSSSPTAGASTAASVQNHGQAEVEDDIEESQQSWMDARESKASRQGSIAVPVSRVEPDAADLSANASLAAAAPSLAAPTKQRGFQYTEQRAVDKEALRSAKSARAVTKGLALGTDKSRTTSKKGDSTSEEARRLSDAAGQRSLLSFKLKPMGWDDNVAPSDARNKRSQPSSSVPPECHTSAETETETSTASVLERGIQETVVGHLQRYVDVLASITAPTGKDTTLLRSLLATWPPAVDIVAATTADGRAGHHPVLVQQASHPALSLPTSGGDVSETASPESSAKVAAPCSNSQEDDLAWFSAVGGYLHMAVQEGVQAAAVMAKEWLQEVDRVQALAL